MSKFPKPTDEIFPVTTQVLIIFSQVVFGNEFGEFLITGQFVIRETRRVSTGTYITSSKVAISLLSTG
jgi:hypothetical protein